MSSSLLTSADTLGLSAIIVIYSDPEVLLSVRTSKLVLGRIKGSGLGWYSKISDYFGYYEASC